MRILLVLTTIALFGLPAVTAAQSTDFGVGAYVGVSLPMSDYGDDDPNDDDAAHAGPGVAAGLDLYYPLGQARRAWWLTSIGVNSHPVDDVDFPGADVGGFLHFPLFTGLRYDIPIGGYAAYLAGQVGAVFIKAPDVESDAFSRDSDWTTQLGFALGAGFQATERVHLGARWIPLGDVDLNYDDTTAGATVTTSDVQHVSFLDIFIGFSVR